MCFFLAVLCPVPSIGIAFVFSLYISVLVGIFFPHQRCGNIDLGWIRVGISPSECYCSLSRSCHRLVFCSWQVFDRAISVDYGVPRLGFAQLLS